MSLDSVLRDLTTPDKELSAAQLAELSVLTGQPLAAFKEAWDALNIERRRQATFTLVELAEDNFDLDFIPVFRHALSDEDSDIRAQAVAGLWDSEDRGLITPLIHLATEDSAEHVRSAATQGLGRFALLAEKGRLLPRDFDRIGAVLIRIIDNDDESLEVHRRAIEAVSPMDIPRVKEIIDAAFMSEEPELRASAIYAMGHSCQSEWLPTLLAELDSPKAELRYEAANALGELGEPEAIVYLVPLIRDADAQVQQAVILALGAIGGPIAQKALQRALDTNDFHIQELVAEALESMEGDDDPLGLDTRP